MVQLMVKKVVKTELQRIISKRGLASRTGASKLILEGLVSVNGNVCLDPSRGFDPRSIIEIKGQEVLSTKRHYLILNKPKGFVVTSSDEKNRPTVYECLKNWNGPLVQAVGRLDLASEGLLLFTNDHHWANRLTDPKTHLKKTYHVQVSTIPCLDCLKKLSSGIMLDGLKTLPANFTILRTGDINSWIQVELHEGRNRQIRKMLQSENIEVLRLIRVQIGQLELGDLPKGQWKELSVLESRLLFK
jgi:23S rRNA pseudouridine2605 synthase